MVSHEYPESVAILRRLLARGHDVTLLTNFAADTFRLAQERFPALAETRGATVSGEVKLIMWRSPETTWATPPGAIAAMRRDADERAYERSLMGLLCLLDELPKPTLAMVNGSRGSIA